MKIGIATIVDYNNYGNRLQNYALSYLLKNLEHEVVTIRNNSNAGNSNLSLLKKIANNLKSGTLIKNGISKISSKKYQQQNELRLNNFKHFTDTYIDETIGVYDANLTSNAELDSFDCFVIGSDQVWNYTFSRFSKFDFLLNLNQPKISYAASFGVDHLTEEVKLLFKEGLSELEEISVRETQGKKIINELLPTKDVQVVLDPTLLLDKNDWKLIVTSKPFEKKYILTYFLEEPLDETKEYIKNIAKKYKLEIKNLGNIHDTNLWVTDPSEFVSLFSQAEYIFTDSFHACAFSIVFEKYFEVFERNTKLKSMNSRIETLMSNLHTGNRWHKGNLELLDMPDYSIINEYLGQQKKESLFFLESALNACQKKIGEK